MDLYQRKKTDSPTQNQEIQSKKRGKIKEKSEEKFFTKKSLDIFFLIHVCHLEYQSRISNLFSFFQSDFKQKRLDLKWHKGHLYNRCSVLRYQSSSPVVVVECLISSYSQKITTFLHCFSIDTFIVCVLILSIAWCCRQGPADTINGLKGRD